MAIRSGTPLLFAALGETITQRSGVLNLGIEGMMAVGALSGFAITYYSGNPWLGVLMAMVAGASIAFLHGFICISLKAVQAVSGIMLVMLGLVLPSQMQCLDLRRKLRTKRHAMCLGRLGE